MQLCQLETNLLMTEAGTIYAKPCLSRDYPCSEPALLFQILLQQQFSSYPVQPQVRYNTWVQAGNFAHKYVRSVQTKISTKAARVYTNCDLPSFSVLRKETIEKNRHFFHNKIIFFVRIFCLHPWKNLSIVDLMPLSYEAENHYLLCQYVHFCRETIS